MEARTISFWRSNLTLFSCESLLFEVLAQNQKVSVQDRFLLRTLVSALDRLKTIRQERSNKVIFRLTFRCRSVNQSDLTDKVTQVLLFGWKYCSKYLCFSESALSKEPGPFSPGLEYNSDFKSVSL